MSDILTDLMRYGEIVEDYELEDKQKGCIRVTKYKDVTTNDVFTLVLINGEIISIGLEMEW